MGLKLLFLLAAFIFMFKIQITHRRTPGNLFRICIKKFLATVKLALKNIVCPLWDKHV